MLLRVVGSCCAKFEAGQTFSYVQTDVTTPIIIVGHQCWESLHPLARCLTLAQPCAIGQPLLANNSQHCCVRLHILLHVVARFGNFCATGQTFSYVLTDATTPNMVGPTMLGVVASVCTDLMPNIYQPKLIIGITP